MLPANFLVQGLMNSVSPTPLPCSSAAAWDCFCCIRQACQIASFFFFHCESRVREKNKWSCVFLQEPEVCCEKFLFRKNLYPVRINMRLLHGLNLQSDLFQSRVCSDFCCTCYKTFEQQNMKLSPKSPIFFCDQLYVMKLHHSPCWGKM